MTLNSSTAMVLVLLDGKIMCGNVMVNAYLEMSLVKINAITIVTSTAMVLVSTVGQKMCGNAMMNVYL